MKYYSFVGIHPPLLFLRTRRKRRAPCTVEKKKRGFGVQTCGNRASGLLRRWLECCAKSAETLVHCSPDRASRWCSAWEMCGMVRISLLCVDCLGVQECTAEDLLHCASLPAIAAQCALWVRGGKCSVLSNREERSASLQRTTPLRQPSAPPALALLQNETIDQRSKRCSALHYSRVPHKPTQRRVVFIPI